MDGVEVAGNRLRGGYGRKDAEERHPGVERVVAVEVVQRTVGGVREDRPRQDEPAAIAAAVAGPGRRLLFSTLPQLPCNANLDELGNVLVLLPVHRVPGILVAGALPLEPDTPPAAWLLLVALNVRLACRVVGPGARGAGNPQPRLHGRVRNALP